MGGWEVAACAGGGGGEGADQRDELAKDVLLRVCEGARDP